MDDQLSFAGQGTEPTKARLRKVNVSKQDPGLLDAAASDPNQPLSSSPKAARKTQTAKQYKARVEAPKPSKPVIKESFQELETRHIQLQQESRNLKALAAKLGVPLPQSQDLPSPHNSPAELGRRLQMEQMQLAFCILDVSEMNFQIQYASPEFCRLSGYPASSLVNLSYRDLPCSPMINLSKYRKLEVALKFRRDESVEMVHQLLDGKQFYSLVLVTHLPSALTLTARPFVVALYSSNSVSPMCTPDIPYRTMLTKQLSLTAGLPFVENSGFGGSLASSPRMYTAAPARSKCLSVLASTEAGLLRSASVDHYLSPENISRSVGFCSNGGSGGSGSSGSGGSSVGHVNIPAGMVLAPYPRTHRPSILRALSTSASLPFPAAHPTHITHSTQVTHTINTTHATHTTHNLPSTHATHTTHPTNPTPTPLNDTLAVFEESPLGRLHGGFGSHSSMSTGSALTRNSSFCSTSSTTTDLGADPQLCADFTRCGMENRIVTMEDRASNYFSPVESGSTNSGVTTHSAHSSVGGSAYSAASSGSGSGKATVHDTGMYSVDMVLSSKSAELPVKVQKRKGKHTLPKVARARSNSEVNEVVSSTSAGLKSSVHRRSASSAQSSAQSGVQGGVQVSAYSSAAPLYRADEVVSDAWAHTIAPPAPNSSNTTGVWGGYTFDTFPLRAALPHSDTTSSTTVNTTSNTTEVGEHPVEHLSATTSVEMDEDSDGAFEFLSALFD